MGDHPEAPITTAPHDPSYINRTQPAQVHTLQEPWLFCPPREFLASHLCFLANPATGHSLECWGPVRRGWSSLKLLPCQSQRKRARALDPPCLLACLQGQRLTALLLAPLVALFQMLGLALPCGPFLPSDPLPVQHEAHSSCRLGFLFLVPSF